MNGKILKSFFFILTTSAVIQSTLQSKAVSEVADSEVPEAQSPASSEGPLAADPKVSLPILPLPGTTEINAEQVAILQSLPCPGGEYCSGLPSEFNPMCSNFINSEGTYPENSTGLLMLDAMQEVEGAHQNDPVRSKTAQCSFFENINFGRSCPNFKHMTPRQKQHVWIWFWAAVAQDKSSCNPDVETRRILNANLGRYEVLEGLNGLERHFDARQASGRDSRFCPHESADTKNLFFQSRCAASIMYDKSCRGNINAGSLSGNVLRLMQKHPLCNSSPQSSDPNPESIPST